MRPPVHRTREPIFGEGAVPFVLQVAGIAIALGLVLGTLLLAKSTYSIIRISLFGESHQSLQPGESAVVDGVTIKRIN